MVTGFRGLTHQIFIDLMVFLGRMLGCDMTPQDNEALLSVVQVIDEGLLGAMDTNSILSLEIMRALILGKMDERNALNTLWLSANFLTIQDFFLGERMINIEQIDSDRQENWMIEKTLDTYTKKASTYALLYEVSPMMQKKTADNYLNYFIWRVGKLSEKKKKLPVLVIGCGSGIDACRISNEGFIVHAVDYSKEMINLLTSRKHENVTAIHNDLEDIFYEDNSVSAILIDSALQHKNKDNVFALLKKYYDWLVEDGVLLFRVRSLESGNVFIVSDMLGYRSFTSWNDLQFEELIDYLILLGFDIDEVKKIEHANANTGRPGFRSVSATKKRKSL